MLRLSLESLEKATGISSLTSHYQKQKGSERHQEENAHDLYLPAGKPAHLASCVGSVKKPPTPTKRWQWNLWKNAGQKDDCASVTPTAIKRGKEHAKVHMTLIQSTTEGHHRCKHSADQGKKKEKKAQ